MKQERVGTNQNWGNRLSPLLVPSFGCQHGWEHDEIQGTAPTEVPVLRLAKAR